MVLNSYIALNHIALNLAHYLGAILVGPESCYNQLSTAITLYYSYTSEPFWHHSALPR